MSTTHTDVTNPDVQHTDSDGRARTWLKPGQVDQLRDVCLTDAVPTYLQDRNEAIVALLYDASLRTGKLCTLEVAHLDLDAGRMYLLCRIQKGLPPPATLELARNTVRLFRRYLRDRWKDTDALFLTWSSGHLTTRSLQYLVEKLATEADVRPQVAVVSYLRASAASHIPSPGGSVVCRQTTDTTRQRTPSTGKTMMRSRCTSVRGRTQRPRLLKTPRQSTKRTADRPNAMAPTSHSRIETSPSRGSRQA